MKTMVTGGAGFIGSHLCEKLVKLGEEVICIDNFDSYYDPKRKRENIRELTNKKNFTLIEADVRDTKKIMEVFKKYKPGRVAHLAALPGVRNSIDKAKEYADVNLNGTISVLESSCKTGCKNFILASTSSIYGKTKKVPFTENQETDKPLAPYPASKKAAEVMAYAYHNLFGLNISVLRFFTAYGPRVRPDMMSYTVMDKISKGREITLFDNKKLSRDWTYIDDVISGIVSALGKPLGYEIINIGRGRSVNLRNFVGIIEEIADKKAKINEAVTPKSEPEVTFANITKAKRLLGYRPKTFVSEGLKATWEWYKTLKV